MAFELKDRFETTDGSRPEPSLLAEKYDQELPLTAFSVVAGGDAFDGTGSAPAGLADVARSYVASKIGVELHSNAEEHAQRVVADIARQLSGNSQLVARLEVAKEITIDLVPPGVSIASFGYPKAVSRNASGIYWDHPDWKAARIALRITRLDEEPALVVHEMAHAVHGLAFTKREHEAIYSLLRPTFGSRAAMDEVFAIYSEKEFLDSFSGDQKRAPGVYGFTRRQWSENHLFTRFVRKLYWPHKPLAGPQMGRGDWMRGIGRR